MNHFDAGFPLDLDESSIIQIDDEHKKIHLGKRKVYHATCTDSAKQIISDNYLKKGTNGMFGSGIYFALNPTIAKSKVKHAHHSSDAFIECMVDFGDSLILDEPDHDITLEMINNYGCQSILGRSQVGHKWEFVVFESSRTKPKRMVFYNQIWQKQLRY